MDLEHAFIDKVESLGKVTWKRMFGLECVLVGKKLMGGFKKIDESVIYLMLILSTKGFKEAIKSGYFSKFDFGQTWVETELTSEEDLQRTQSALEESYNFAKTKVK